MTVWSFSPVPKTSSTYTLEKRTVEIEHRENSLHSCSNESSFILVVPNQRTMMHSTVQHGGNKSGGKSNVWVNNTNLVKTMAALDEFQTGFPSNGLTTVSNKWWGRSGKDAEGENTEEEEEEEDGDVKDEAASEKQSSLLAVRKRMAEQGREAVEVVMRQGFSSKRVDKRDHDLLSQIFKSSLPKDWVTDSS